MVSPNNAKITHLRGASALHLLLHARVSDDQTAFVEHVVTDQAIDEFLHLGSELRSLPFEFRQRPIEAVRDGDVASLQLSLQLDVVIPRHTQRGAGQRHDHYRLQRVDDPRTAIHEVSRTRMATSIPTIR